MAYLSKAVNKILFNTCCIILAAGEGKRMNSNAPKVLSEVLFKPMLGWIIDAVHKSEIEDICIVKGFKHEMVQSFLDTLDFKCESVIQKERKGTAHAVMTAESFIKKHSGGDVLILGGDSPFIDKTTILESYKKHKLENNSATIVSSKVDNPFGYGRIVRDTFSGAVLDIVEAYWFKVDDLLLNLFNISNNTSQNEYYLTSIIKLFLEEKLKVAAFNANSAEVVLGANDLDQLENLNKIARDKVINSLIENGVKIPFRDGVIIGSDVFVQKGATIYPNTIILGQSFICSGAKVGPNSQVINSKIGENAVFNSSYCKDSIILEEECVNPFTCQVKGNTSRITLDERMLKKIKG